jgi:hypothetical protein
MPTPVAADPHRPLARGVLQREATLPPAAATGQNDAAPSLSPCIKHL